MKCSLISQRIKMQDKSTIYWMGKNIIKKSLSLKFKSMIMKRKIYKGIRDDMYVPTSLFIRFKLVESVWKIKDSILRFIQSKEHMRNTISNEFMRVDNHYFFKKMDGNIPSKIT